MSYQRTAFIAGGHGITHCSVCRSAGAGRASYAPIVERTKALHVGLAGYWRKPTILEGEASGGWGAFEVAARVSRIDLDDEADDLVGGVRGGVSQNASLALNWYFNPYVRLSLNYVHAEIDNLDEQGGGTVDGVAMRLRWEF